MFFKVLSNTAQAIQKSFTPSKDNLVATFKSGVSRQEGLVCGKFGKDSSPYIEFFPLGITEYRKATMDNVLNLMNGMADLGQEYVADLGNDFIEFQKILNNYQSACTAIGDVESLSTIDVASDIDSMATITFRNTGSITLMICTTNNPGDPCDNEMNVDPGEQIERTGNDSDPLDPYFKIANNHDTELGTYELIVDNG